MKFKSKICKDTHFTTNSKNFYYEGRESSFGNKMRTYPVS